MAKWFSLIQEILPLGPASETLVSFNGFLRNLRTSFPFLFGAREKLSMVFLFVFSKHGIPLSTYALCAPHVPLSFPRCGAVQLGHETLGFNTIWLYCITLHILQSGCWALTLAEPLQLHGCEMWCENRIWLGDYAKDSQSKQVCSRCTFPWHGSV